MTTLKTFRFTINKNGTHLKYDVKAESMKKAESILIKYQGEFTFLGCKELQ